MIALRLACCGHATAPIRVQQVGNVGHGTEEMLAGAHISFLQRAWNIGTRTRSSVEETRHGRRQCGAPLRQQFRCEIEVAAMNVAPAPGLAALEGCDQWMTGGVEMLKRVRVRRILAASDM